MSTIDEKHIIEEYNSLLTIYSRRGLADFAAKHNNFDLLKWAYTAGCRLRANTIRIAIVNNNIEMVKWLHANGCKVSLFDGGSTCSYIGLSGNLDLLKWFLFEVNMQWDPYTCQVAIENNHIQMVNWILEMGFDIKLSSFNAAIHTGNLELFKKMTQTKSFSESTLTYFLRSALESNNLHILEYMVKSNKFESTWSQSKMIAFISQISMWINADYIAANPENYGYYYLMATRWLIDNVKLPVSTEIKQWLVATNETVKSLTPLIISDIQYLIETFI